MSKFEYLRLADAVAAEIASGGLKPGDRLPPQRSFAYERKIAVSTASRVYTELLRRGLVVGEVGRGTFISGEARRGIAALSRAARRAHRSRIQLSAAADPGGDDRQKPGRHCSGRKRSKAALRQATSTGTQACAKHLRRFSRPQRLDAQLRADRLHRQRPAMHCGRACRGGAGRRTLRRRGADLSLHQGHRRPARRDAGAAGDGRTWRAAGRRAEGPSRSASVGAVRSADHPESARHDHAGGAPHRSVARGRETRSHRSSKTTSTAFSTTSRRWPRSRRTAASCSTACRRKWRRAWRSASSWRRHACARTSLRRCAPADGPRRAMPSRPAQRLMGDGTAAELARLKRIDAAAAPADRRRMPRRLRDPDQLPSPIICG